MRRSGDSGRVPHQRHFRVLPSTGAGGPHQREDQARRRAELGERWQETDLVVDAGDGRAVSPVNFSSVWRLVSAPSTGLTG
jgi:hypothetical protein